MNLKRLKIDLMAPWFLLKSVAKRMRDSKLGGSIIFLTTFLGTERGLYSGVAATGSCMASVEQLTRLSALEIGNLNIRVNAIARGLHLGDAYPMSIGRDKAESSTTDVMPLQRWLDPKNDLASTVIYLVDDDSRLYDWRYYFHQWSPIYCQASNEIIHVIESITILTFSSS